MAQIINTNIMSLNAQRNLNASQSSLATSMQRLSSGLRINSAKDDAAGLAISERFTTQIRGLNTAIRNANDAISLSQTAEGALASVGGNLQRIRELAVQSANATNSATDRAALNAEVAELVSEIDRVARQTEFNGTRLLDGSFTAQLFQIGANAGQAISINETADAKTTKLGNAVFGELANSPGATTDPGGAAAAGTITGMTVTDSLGNVVTLNDVHFSIGDTAEDINKRIVAAINERIGETGLIASTDGTNINFNTVRESVDDTGAYFAYEFTGGTSSDTSVVVADDASLTQGANNQFVADINISTAVGAHQAITIVDKGLTVISGARANLGAIQNRFMTTIENLQINSENLTASRSRIMDADFAAETANLSRAQILQQAGTAMLAQANQIPQQVLSLLQR
jgi:flagellin